MVMNVYSVQGSIKHRMRAGKQSPAKQIKLFLCSVAYIYRIVKNNRFRGGFDQLSNLYFVILR